MQLGSSNEAVEICRFWRALLPLRSWCWAKHPVTHWWCLHNSAKLQWWALLSPASTKEAEESLSSVTGVGNTGDGLRHWFWWEGKHGSDGHWIDMDTWIHVLQTSRLHGLMWVDEGWWLHTLHIASAHWGSEEEMCYSSESPAWTELNHFL